MVVYLMCAELLITNPKEFSRFDNPFGFAPNY